MSNKILITQQKHYGKGSPDRIALEAVLKAFEEDLPMIIPAVVGGREVSILHL